MRINSKASFSQCIILMITLQLYFGKRVSEITTNLSLDLGVWEDGVIGEKEMVFDRTEFSNPNVYVHAWSNVWERGTG